MISRIAPDGRDGHGYVSQACVGRLVVDDTGVFYTCRNSDSAAADQVGLFHLDPETWLSRQLHRGSDNLTAVTTDALRIYWVDLADDDSSVWTLCKSAMR